MSNETLQPPPDDAVLPVQEGGKGTHERVRVRRARTRRPGWVGSEVAARHARHHVQLRSENQHLRDRVRALEEVQQTLITRLTSLLHVALQLGISGGKENRLQAYFAQVQHSTGAQEGVPKP